MDSIITDLAENIKNSCELLGCPLEMIIMFSRKQDADGQTGSCKLALILKDSPCLPGGELEGKLYIGIDSPASFDLMIYEQYEWETLIGAFDTFAYKVNQIGVKLFVQPKES